MTSRSSFIALAGILVAVCAVAPVTAAGPAGPILGQPFTLMVGTSTIVGPVGLTVGFTGVTSDSRCPINVVCFWEGDAATALWAELPGRARADFELHTYYEWEHSEIYQGFLITLQGVGPPRVYPDPIDPDSYVVTLLVTQLEVPVESRTWGGIKAIYD